MIDHALAYAAAGLPVLPLLPRDKPPACAHGKDDATTDPDRIARWWKQRPDCNIGIRPPRGLVVLDVDAQHGGPEALAQITSRYGQLPETWSARTGQGGQHIWLRADGPFRGKLCSGVDIKSNSGYLVAAPSLHPNGNRYEWLNAAPIAPAPAWLRPLIAPKPAPPSPPRGMPVNTTGLVAAVASAPRDNRNNMLYWAARRAISEGTYAELREQLAQAAMVAGLDEREVRRTLSSAAGRRGADA